MYEYQVLRSSTLYSGGTTTFGGTSHQWFSRVTNIIRYDFDCPSHQVLMLFTFFAWMSATTTAFTASHHYSGQNQILHA
jgi:hypothetical protein